ncbi:putative tyrosyl-DNA phosphodiesterase [Colletotrichum siamense]|uniref:Tyrosyl-DNA phosphodiesterase n=1 Tax=Colletotrichum siamense TaxID=690259 RepID=A0A9P5BPD7_COLSI|nr:putative tyrosyl-DNA phosphodiesterase [Colletotrichum siamense]KAF4845058.1 putative tyrosyl-DNA phosphodiesterase [Colletotrichum siamense]
MDIPAKRKRVVIDLDEWEAARSRRSTSDVHQAAWGGSQPEVIDPEEWEASRRKRNLSAADLTGPPQTPSHKQDDHVIPSPFRLTRIPGLGDSANRDAVTLGDLVGDPSITELWEFNYLHDIPFLISHIDESSRTSISVHVVHGFWKADDRRRTELERDAGRHPNVLLHTAHMPEMFGTHHCKMMILFRRNRSAQIIIHTANMTPKDWNMMTNGVWASPLLACLPNGTDPRLDTPGQIGTGSRFKHDMLAYLKAYERRGGAAFKHLVDRLLQFDFSLVRAAFVASVPGRHRFDESVPSMHRWGWPGLRRALQAVPTSSDTSDGSAEIVIQVSTISTLGPKDNWLRSCLLDTLVQSSSPAARAPRLRLVFPTVENIRRCVGGYSSGSLIVTKTQSKQQAKQLDYLRPMLCRWASDSRVDTAKDSGRGPAAPHIKTYVRFSGSTIDWALLTSANLSRQAWGERPGKSEHVRIASWEVGVLVWPGILGGDQRSKMVAAFMSDTPRPTQAVAAPDSVAARGGVPFIGLRLPYSLPLQPYGASEQPWVSSLPHMEPDGEGRTWCPRPGV